MSVDWPCLTKTRRPVDFKHRKRRHWSEGSMDHARSEAADAKLQDSVCHEQLRSSYGSFLFSPSLILMLLIMTINCKCETLLKGKDFYVCVCVCVFNVFTGWSNGNIMVSILCTVDSMRQECHKSDFPSCMIRAAFWIWLCQPLCCIANSPSCHYVYYGVLRVMDDA